MLPLFQVSVPVCIRYFPHPDPGRSVRWHVLQLRCPVLFDSPTSGTIAASSWSSPSSFSSGASSCASFVASTTLSTSACFALPFVEWESIATIGSFPVRTRKESAEEIAMFASFSGSGFCSSPASPKIKVPFAPHVAVRNDHQEESGNQFCSRFCLQDLKARTKCVCSGVACSGKPFRQRLPSSPS